MSFGSGNDMFKVKTFESQNEVEEKRRRRQEEWDKVRKPDDPEECPEEETRSLFEQLQENKELKEKEYEEQFKLRNSIKGLEEEEVKFLEHVSNRQIELEKERHSEEQELIGQLKEAAVKRVADRTSPVAETKKSITPPAIVSATSSKKSQQSLLHGAIKRKSTETSPDDSQKRKKSDDDSEGRENKYPDLTPNTDVLMALIDTSSQIAQVAGILPGIGSYNGNSSDSESSSAESDIEDYLQPKKIVFQNVQLK